MKGIYLTEEGKQDIEAKIADLEINLEKHVQYCKITGCHYDYQFEQGIEFYKEILSSATILPVAETWHDIHEEDVANWSEINYSQGVIIQPKQ
jgi:hypothetical protein